MIREFFAFSSSRARELCWITSAVVFLLSLSLYDGLLEPWRTSWRLNIDLQSSWSSLATTFWYCLRATMSPLISILSHLSSQRRHLLIHLVSLAKLVSVSRLIFWSFINWYSLGTSSNRASPPSPTGKISPSLTIPDIVNVHRRFSTFLGIPTIAPTSASIPLSDDDSDAPGRETNPPGTTDSNGNGNGNANSNANGNANGNGKGNDKDNGKGHSKLKPVPKGKDKGNAVDINTTITGTDILTDISPGSPTSTPSDGAIAFSDSANIVVSTFTPLPVTTLVTVTQSDSSRILEASATVQSVLSSAARRSFGGVGLGLPGRALDVVGVRVALVGTVIALVQIMLWWSSRDKHAEDVLVVAGVQVRPDD